MHKVIVYIETLFILLVTAGCSHSEVLDLDALQVERKLCLTFQGDELSRSNLTGSDVGYDHIEKVFLFVFEGHDANAKCIFNEDIGWVKGDIHKKYWISTQLKANSDYTFIAVGGDANSVSEYTFPNGVKVNESTLGTVMAKALNANTAAVSEVKGAMSTAELFVGQVSQHVSDESAIHVEMTLRRKVAGVIAYLRNIPWKVNFDGNDVIVKEVKIKLSAKQNTEVALWKQADEEIYGRTQLTDDDQYLFSWKVDTYGNDGDVYLIPAETSTTGGLNTLPNTLFTGAFLLPIQKNSSPTLLIELWGNHSGTDKVVKTYEITHKDKETGTTTEQFDIRENCLYSIGKKISAGTTDGDIPADLSGNLLNIEVIKWTDCLVGNDFGSVVGPARILSDINPDNYIFDAPGTMFKIRVREGKSKPSAVSKTSNTPKWSLKIDYQPGNKTFNETVNDWIHIATLDSEGKKIIGYTNNIDCPSGETQDLVIVLNDYAVKRNLQKTSGAEPSANGYYIYDPDLVEKFKKDYREAYLVVETEGTATPFKYSIRQYNALTVSAPTFTDRPDHFRGMARLDYGCYFDKQTGELKEGKDVLIDWGYFTSINWYIYGANYMDDYDGGINTSVLFQRYDEKLGAHEAYIGSAVQKLRKTEIKVEGSPLKDNGNLHWYLPAYQEMWEISNYMNSNRSAHEACSILFNMKINHKYWTSTGCRWAPTHSYNVVIGATPSDDIHTDRTEKLRARPIRHFKAVNK